MGLACLNTIWLADVFKIFISAGLYKFANLLKSVTFTAIAAVSFLMMAVETVSEKKLKTYKQDVMFMFYFNLNA
jgi:hypothetical protein